MNQNVQSFNLELSLDEINVILAGLGELPFKVAGPLVDKIRNQVVPQVQANQPKAEETVN